jgi:hypothetical protein
MVDGDDLVFEEEISILDVSDGLDAVGFVLSADTDRTIYDTVGLAFVPTSFTLRAYWSNIATPTLYWYKNKWWYIHNWW